MVLVLKTTQLTNHKLVRAGGAQWHPPDTDLTNSRLIAIEGGHIHLFSRTFQCSNDNIDMVTASLKQSLAPYMYTHRPTERWMSRRQHLHSKLIKDNLQQLHGFNFLNHIVLNSESIWMWLHSPKLTLELLNPYVCKNRCKHYYYVLVQ